MSERIVAAIDIGTNTLLTAVGRSRADGSVEVLGDWGSITRLGAGVDRTRTLREDAMARALDAIRDSAARAISLGATMIRGVATSAVRDAINRAEFLHRVNAVLRATTHDADVQVIGGAREADLTTSDPPTQPEIDSIARDVRESLHGAFPTVAKHSQLVGVAATVATLRGIDAGVPYADWLRTHGTTLSLAAVERCIATLAVTTRRERETMATIDPLRADVIVAGAVIVRELMRWSGDDALTVSCGGVRMGLLAELLAEPAPRPD